MNNQGKGLKDWQASLTPEQRKKIASRGGIARAKKLKSGRRQEIAKMGATRRWLIHAAKVKPLE